MTSKGSKNERSRMFDAFDDIHERLKTLEKDQLEMLETIKEIQEKILLLLIERSKDAKRRSTRRSNVKARHVSNE